jgi:glucosamine--fructose-6-phosphate aminotransferase (isomerizing)
VVTKPTANSKSPRLRASSTISKKSLRNLPIDGVYGIGHTRWATHGRPTEENAHPHRDCTGEIVVVHNGIVENYVELKHQLDRRRPQIRHRNRYRSHRPPGRKIFEDGGPLEDAVRKTVKQLTGVYAWWFFPRATRIKSSPRAWARPSVIGLGQNEYFVASDIPAILAHTRDVFFLADGDLAVLTPQGVRVMDFDGRTIDRPVQHITWDPIMAEKGGFKHFMQKEIFEQPRAVRDTLLGRMSLDSGRLSWTRWTSPKKNSRNFAISRSSPAAPVGTPAWPANS